MKKRSFVFLLTSFLCAAGSVYSQAPGSRQISPVVQKAIARSYAACVKMFAYDTLLNQQMSAPFSGVVVSKEGHILTAAHVTDPGKTYRVIFPDGKECIAVALGKIDYAVAPMTPDVAMMRLVTGSDWPYTGMGTFYDKKIGMPCLSISYPETMFITQPTIRFGYISRLKNERGFMETTCIMEPGDSGGALLDTAGNVIGLHSGVEIKETVNYEVPIDLYRKYWTALNEPVFYKEQPQTDAIDAKYLKAIDSTASQAHLDFSKEAMVYKGTCITVTSAHYGHAEGAVFLLKKGAVIVSKSSLLNNDSVALWIAGKRIAATVIARDRSNDLVLLQPAAELKAGIVLSKQLADTAFVTKPGTFLASPQPDTTAIISVAGNAPFQSVKNFSIASLGAVIAFNSMPLLFTYVQAGSPAATAGIVAGDEVLSINGVELKAPEQYGQELTKTWPGDTVSVRLKRNDSMATKSVVMGAKPQRAVNHPAELFAGGKSVIRDGFAAKVFSHDAVITADKCGGPLFDLGGHFIGINIARYSRAATMVMPADVVYKFVLSYAK